MKFEISGHWPLLVFAAVCLACGGGEAPAPPPPAEPAAPPEVAGPSSTEPEAPLVVFLGDSLTAGYGLDDDQAFPHLVAAQLETLGRPIRAVNAGVSGDTTAGGLRRLEWILRQEPDLLVVALGGNDGLRGVDLETSEANLRQIIETAQEREIPVLLAGMLIPPNYGQDYARQFAEIYPKLESELGVARIPFLLEGVAARPELNLPDGIHPNIEGQEKVARTVLEHLLPLLDALPESS